MITVRVPGTSANLGPGFDCFGIALGIYGYFGFEECEAGIRFEGVDEKYCNEDNLAVVAYRRAVREMGLAMKGLKVKIESDVPVSRGLGSSASLIVAGVFGANANHGNLLTRQQMLSLVTELEGHPDNVAPALLGGMTASIVGPEGVHSMSCAISEKVRVCVLVPDFELETKKSRAALPKRLDIQDAIFNISRAAVLLKALECGDFETISVSMDDRLHQPYRKGLIDEYDRVRALAMECGAASFCISGAGPTLLCIHEGEDFAGKMKEAVKALKNNWRVLPLKVDRQGAVILEGE